jgi:U3 small nucleolar RNA-associated protein MPP10
MYNDFFPPPREEYVRPPRGSGKEKDAKKAKSKSKGKGVSFGDDVDMEVDAEDAEDVERDVMGRVKGDLFADDDEAEQEEAEKSELPKDVGLIDTPDLSTHEKRQIALRAQIAQLESDVVGPKDWTLLGEASSRARPENSLLEENLEFEQVGKVVPVITEESVKTLEELIKSRIRDVSH